LVWRYLIFRFKYYSLNRNLKTLFLFPSAAQKSFRPNRPYGPSLFFVFSPRRPKWHSAHPATLAQLGPLLLRLLPSDARAATARPAGCRRTERHLRVLSRAASTSPSITVLPLPLGADSRLKTTAPLNSTGSLSTSVSLPQNVFILYLPLKNL
jgi:hypothetical protein